MSHYGIQQSPEVDKLCAALVKAQSELGNVHKNKTAKVPTKSGGSYEYSYADLPAVRDAVLAACAPNGLGFIQTPGADGNYITVTGRLIHESGQWMEFVSAAIPTDNKPQSVGSCTAYLRRYQMTAVFFIATEDDDGAAASAPARVDEAESRRITADLLAKYDVVGGKAEWEKVNNEAAGLSSKLTDNDLQQVRQAATAAKHAINNRNEGEAA